MDRSIDRDPTTSPDLAVIGARIAEFVLSLDEAGLDIHSVAKRTELEFDDKTQWSPGLCLEHYIEEEIDRASVFLEELRYLKLMLRHLNVADWEKLGNAN